MKVIDNLHRVIVRINLPIRFFTKIQFLGFEDLNEFQLEPITTSILLFLRITLVSYLEIKGNNVANGALVTIHQAAK